MIISTQTVLRERIHFSSGCSSSRCQKGLQEKTIKSKIQNLWWDGRFATGGSFSFPRCCQQIKKSSHKNQNLVDGPFLCTPALVQVTTVVGRWDRTSRQSSPPPSPPPPPSRTLPQSSRGRPLLSCPLLRSEPVLTRSCWAPEWPLASPVCSVTVFSACLCVMVNGSHFN